MNILRSGLLPTQTGDMVVGKQYFGAVSSVTDFGVFVRFMGSCSALALLAQLSESLSLIHERYECEGCEVCYIILVPLRLPIQCRNLLFLVRNWHL